MLGNAGGPLQASGAGDAGPVVGEDRAPTILPTATKSPDWGGKAVRSKEIRDVCTSVPC